MTIEIGRYAPPEDEELHTWHEFKDGFELQIKYLSPKQWRKLFAQSTRKKREWDRSHRPLTVEELDTDKLIENIAEIIVDWKGLTPEVLRTVLVVDVEALKRDMKKEGLKEIPYSENSKMYLLNNARGDFIDFLYSVVLDIEQVEFKRKEDEAKNSSGSSGGGKRPMA